jgi:hypothetical protein
MALFFERDSALYTTSCNRNREIYCAKGEQYLPNAANSVKKLPIFLLNQAK